MEIDDNDNTASKLPDFAGYSSQIAMVSPSGVNSASFTPTNTVARNCPATGVAWEAATALPPTPNQQLCSCMLPALSCVAKPNANDTAVQSLFAEVCGLVQGVCQGITANGTTGVYGAYSMCNATEQLSWAFNAYYQSQKGTQNYDACNFNGAATTQAAASPTGSCASLVSQAGSAGTGVITSVPSGTGSSSGGSSTATKKGAAGMVTVPSFSFGMLSLGVYVMAAAMVGAGMVLL